MSREDQKNPNQRKKTNRRIFINWSQVAKWAEAGSMGAECAARVGLTLSAFYKRCEQDIGLTWKEFKALNRAKGDSMIRETQYNIALGGDPRMLIWLGKNRLGQSDHPEAERAVQSAFEKLNERLEKVGTEFGDVIMQHRKRGVVEECDMDEDLYEDFSDDQDGD